MNRFQNLFRILVLVNTVLVVAVIIFIFSNKTQRIAVVRTGVVLEKYSGMKEAQKLISREESKYTDRLDTLRVLYNQALNNYNADSRVSQSDKKMAEDLISKREQDYNAYQEAAQKKMEEISQKITQGALNQINDAVKIYAEKNRIDLVVGVNLTGNVLCGNPTIDITDELIEILNSGK